MTEVTENAEFSSPVPLRDEAQTDDRMRLHSFGANGSYIDCTS